MKQRPAHPTSELLAAYVIGPYTAETAWQREQNIRHAEAVGLILAQEGIAPFVPHTMCRFYDGTCTPSFWYQATAELLKRSDIAVLTCSILDWQGSKGSTDEIRWCYDNKVPVFCSVYDAIGWIKGVDEPRCIGQHPPSYSEWRQV